MCLIEKYKKANNGKKQLPNQGRIRMFEEKENNK